MLVVGAKGSGQQLVLSTLLLQGTPVGNIDGHVFSELDADPRVALAVPLALGDNVGGARIVGTDRSFFGLGPSLQEPPSFQLAEGRLFAAEFEAVLGSRSAAELGLRVGDSFQPAHGVEPGLENDHHAEVYTVVGVLQPSATPFDNAVLVPIDSVILMHGGLAAPEGEHAATGEEHDEDHDEEHDDEHSGDGDSIAAGQVTAVLVRPTGFVEANELWREFYTGAEAQAVFPGRELGGLFDLLNQGQEILIVVGYLAAIMAALTLFLAIYSATEARQQLLAILRGVGASRRTVVLVVLTETVLLALFGALAGRLLGYATAHMIAGEITRRSAIPVSIGYLGQVEAALWLLPLVLGILAGVLPAWQAYRANVVQRLFPT
jgi:putative ABC transport system permease protein